MTLPAAIRSAAKEGVLVSLDETGEYSSLTVTMPILWSAPESFITACHNLAGELGANIVWKQQA